MTAQGRKAVIDIGRSGIRVLVAECLDESRIRILGAGEVPSRHFDREVPLSMKDMIDQAIEAAEDSIGGEIDSVDVGVSGTDLLCSSTDAALLVTRDPEDRESSRVRREHIEKLRDRVEQGDNLHIDRDLLHSLQEEYEMDGVPGVKNPLDLHAVRLGCKSLCITVPSVYLRSLRTCMDAAVIKVEGMHLTSLALTEFISADEQLLGTLLLDIGASSTDILLVRDGRIRHAASLPIGGEAITRDIMSAFQLTRDEAERIKLQFGVCHVSEQGEDPNFFMNGMDGGFIEITQSQLCQVIQPRMEEILEQVVIELKRANVQWLLGAGVVITGGGSQLKGLPELIMQQYRHPVRALTPTGIIDAEKQPELAIWTPALALAKRVLSGHAASAGRKPLRIFTDFLGRVRDQVAL
jgi:cell division protein FtsA